MKASPITLRKAYVLFVGLVVLLIIASQVFIRYDLNLQNNDARFINKAGRERMLSQRIAKLTLYIENDIRGTGQILPQRLDSLRFLAAEFGSIYLSLPSVNDGINNLLDENRVRLDDIINATRIIDANRGPIETLNAIDAIKTNELPFLLTMERIVNAYQHENERKLDAIKFMEIIFAFCAIGLLGIGLTFILIPVTTRLEKKNEQLVLLKDALVVREEQFRKLVENSSEMIYEVNERGEFTYVNPVAERITGFSQQELLTKRYFELIPEDSRDRVINFYVSQLKERKLSSYQEFPIVVQGDKILWIGQSLSLHFDKGSWTAYAVARDITELKEVRLKLEENEKLYSLLIENSQDLVALHEPDGTFKYLSPAVKSMLGYTEEELINTKAIDLAHPDDREMLIKAQDQDVRSGVARTNLVFRLKHKYGHYVWGEVTAVPITDEHGKVRFILTDNRNITERVNLEQKLVERERLFRLLSENSQDFISLHSPDATYQFVSTSVHKLLGYKPEELVGRSPYEFIHPDDQQRLKEGPHAKLLEGIGVMNVEYRFQRNSGDYIWMEAYTQPIMENGILVSFQTSSRDISKRKSYEFALIEEKLRAEKATQVKSDFLSMMSHEIRTPLNGIIGMSNVLALHDPKPEQVEMIRLLKFSGENLLTIINDILDFNKMEAGKVHLERIPFDLFQLIRDTLDILDTRCKEKGIQLHLKYASNVRTFIGDPVRLNQIVNNLVTNAIKFTEQGSVTVSIHAVAVSEKTYEIVISIADTGIGIAPDKLQSIFEGFTQAGADITRKYGGTGLGLSISRRLVELMKGSLSVQSALGAGSTFLVALHLDKGDLAEKKVSNAVSFSDRNIKVLLVEDNKPNQVVASLFLKKKGLHVTIAENGEAAIKALENKNVDLVLMDLQMPVMDGYEATRIIRESADTYFQQLPIIALTSNLLSDVEAKVLNCGMNGCMSKPFKAEELLAIIATHIR